MRYAPAGCMRGADGDDVANLLTSVGTRADDLDSSRTKFLDRIVEIAAKTQGAGFGIEYLVLESGGQVGWGVALEELNLVDGLVF